METSNTSLENLPAELLYRIVDYLDSQTILLSFRYVCRRFRSIAENANRFELDLTLIKSKDDFERLCHLINPAHLLSLTLIDNEETPGQIQHFFSRFQMEQFTQLRSLTLINIEWMILNVLFPDSLPFSLKKLCLILKGKRNRFTLEHLSHLLFQTFLEQLALNTFAHAIDELIVSVHSELRCLTIGICTYNEYQNILRYCPQLRTLVLDECWISDDSPIDHDSLHRLTSLTLKDTNRSIEQLHHLLRLTPMLQFLQIINAPSTSSSLIDGSHWQRFIEKNLNYLTQFQFVFYHKSLQAYYSMNDIEPSMKSFRTPFWIDEKHWFIHCDYVKYLHQTRLYSIPYPLASFDLYFDNENMSLSTSNKPGLLSTLFDRIQQLTIHFNQININQLKQYILNHFNDKQTPLLRHVTELELNLNDFWCLELFDFLDDLVQLTSIDRIKLNVFSQSKLDILPLLFARTYRLKSLSILSSANAENHDIDVQTVCDLIPIYLEHLTLRVQKPKDMQYVLRRLPSLASVTFFVPFHRKIDVQEMTIWLEKLGCRYVCTETDETLSFWLSKI